MAVKKDTPQTAPQFQRGGPRPAISTAIAAINKKFGAGTIDTLANKKDELTLRYIPTRSLLFNNMLYGGFVQGRISELFGPHDSGKTSMGLDTIGFNMGLNPDFRAGWFETEMSFDPDYAMNTFNIDPNRFTYWSMEDYGAEGGLDILDSLIRSRGYDFLVVNTVAGLTPKKEIEGSVGDQDVALQARIMSKLMRKIVGAAAKANTHVLFINQLRTNVGQLYGNPDVTPGGRALAFWATQRVHMRSSKIMANDGYKDDLYKKISCRVEKNRASQGHNPFKKTDYFVQYGVGVDTIGEIPVIAPDLGVLKKGGSYFIDPDSNGNPITMPDGTPAKWNGMAQFREYLFHHTDYSTLLWKRTMDAMAANPAAFGGESMSDEEIQQAEANQAALAADLGETEEA